MTDDASLRVGTSGWVYKHWNDIFYPPKLPSNEKLAFYARHYDTVEVNFSFYRLPERKVFEHWREASPDNFLFAVKASRYLTHITKLAEPDEPLQRLMHRAHGLAEKLGPILLQFPASWKLDLDRLAEFCGSLHPYSEQRFTFEFRHQSWLIPEVYELLREVNAALCLPVSPTVPLDIQLTADWTYIRMHRGAEGTGYSEAELDLWAKRTREFLDRRADAYVYFNNDPEGHALRDAQRLREKLTSA